MALTKKEQADLEEEQRRQKTSVTDLARENGMKGNLPGGGQIPKDFDKPKEAEQLITKEDK